MVGEFELIEGVTGLAEHGMGKHVSGFKPLALELQVVLFQHRLNLIESVLDTASVFLDMDQRLAEMAQMALRIFQGGI
ncbi:MAG: hypothetical protein ACRD3Q_04445 [Terriglobales bacterium]